MKKEIFSPSWIDVLWDYTLKGDLLNSVDGLAMDMQERYIQHRVSKYRAEARKNNDCLTPNQTNELRDMLDYLLDRVDFLYANAQDVRAAFEEATA